MKNKLQIAIPVFAVCVAVVLISGKPNALSDVKSDVKHDAKRETDNIRIPSKEERLKMSNTERIALLERLGSVPDDPNMSDYFYAEKTSWWGKRLNPEEFWKGRVMWFDDEVRFEAHRRGREYPPMPYDEPSVANRSDLDIKSDSFGTLDSPNPRMVSSERESAFWSHFNRTHPMAPINIKRCFDLVIDVDSWLRKKNQLEYNIEKGLTYKQIERSMENSMWVAKRDKEDSVFPMEAITPEAYHWDHVMRKRAEYEDLVVSGRVDDDKEAKWFFDRVLVDRSLITEPLTDEQIDAANAWKVAYLKRLRSEEWDESYINAYLEAWNLTEEYVFENEKEQAHEK